MRQQPRDRPSAETNAKGRAGHNDARAHAPRRCKITHRWRGLRVARRSTARSAFAPAHTERIARACSVRDPVAEGAAPGCA